jgi:hypothetical protein
MMFATRGDNTYVDLYKDKAVLESKVAYIGADFLGFIVPGKSASLWDLLNIVPFFDVHNDPHVTLSQAEGQSKSQTHYGITNPLKIFDEEAESGITWTSFAAGENQTDDLFSIDLDFVSETYGGTIQVPMSLMGKMFKGGVAPGSSMDGVFLGMWFQPYISDNEKHIMLDKLSLTLFREKPALFNVPPEPAGIAMERITGSISGFSSIASDEDGRFKVAVTVKGPFSDSADILESIGDALGMPFLEIIGGGSIEFNKEYWKFVVFAEAEILRSYTLSEVKMSLTVPHKPSLELEVKGSLALLVIDGDAEEKLDNGFLFDISAKADLEVPKFIPFIGGFEFEGVETYINTIIDRDNSHKIDKFLAGLVLEAAITKDWSVEFDMGIELAPKVKVYANKRSAQEEPKINLYMGDVKDVAVDKTRSSELHVNIDKSAETVFIKLSSKDVAPEFDIIFPDGEYFAQKDNSDLNSSSPNLERLFFDIAKNSTYLALHNPPQGSYTLILKNGSTYSDLQLQTIYAPKKIKATLSLEKSSLRSSLRRVSIELEGIDESADVTLYATHKKRFNLGYKISPTKSLKEGISDFDISRIHDILHSGYYHVYARVQEPNRVARFFWLDDMMDFEHENSPDIPEDVKVNIDEANITLSWSQDQDGIKHHWLHVYKEDDISPLHSHFYTTDEKNFNLKGLEPDTRYKVQIESVNDKGYVAYSKPLEFTTTSHSGFKGSPDIHIDKEVTKADILDGNLSVKVCNRGSADLESAVIDIYYKVALPQTMIDDLSVGSIKAGECKSIAFSIHQDIVDHVMKYYANDEESLIFMLEKSSPPEYQQDNNNAYIKFGSDAIFPVAVTKEIVLEKGWNFVSLPLHVSDFPLYNLHAVDRVYAYDKHSGWIRESKKLKSAKGYWIKASERSKTKITGHTYKNSYQDKTPGWHLLGAGEDIKDGVDNPYINMIWVYRDGYWYKNPTLIHAGEAYWAEIE